jgi:hypothetical protein
LSWEESGFGSVILPQEIFALGMINDFCVNTARLLHQQLMQSCNIYIEYYYGNLLWTSGTKPKALDQENAIASDTVRYSTKIGAEGFRGRGMKIVAKKKL